MNLNENGTRRPERFNNRARANWRTAVGIPANLNRRRHDDTFVPARRAVLLARELSTLSLSLSLPLFNKD